MRRGVVKIKNFTRFGRSALVLGFELKVCSRRTMHIAAATWVTFKDGIGYSADRVSVDAIPRCYTHTGNSLLSGSWFMTRVSLCTHIVTCCVLSCCVVSCHVVSCHVVSQRAMSRRDGIVLHPAGCIMCCAMSCH